MSGNSAVFVVGPAGVGKTTFCHSLVQHGEATGRSMHLMNLDPAAENLPTTPFMDIREFVTVDDIMEDIQLGPNGALLYCMDYLVEECEDWIISGISDLSDEFVIVDWPGQIELYTHCTHIRKIIQLFQKAGYNICCVYLMESTFFNDATKYFAGVLNAMAAMIQLEIPHINVISKMDLLGSGTSEIIEKYLYTDPIILSDWIQKESKPEFYRLNEAIVQLIDEYNMVSFIPCNINDEESMIEILAHIDNLVQYGEFQEPKEPKHLGDYEDNSE